MTASQKNQPADLLDRTIIEKANELYKKSRPLGYMPGPFTDLFPQRQDEYKIEAIKQLMEERSRLIDYMKIRAPQLPSRRPRNLPQQRHVCHPPGPTLHGFGYGRQGHPR